VRDGAIFSRWYGPRSGFRATRRGEEGRHQGLTRSHWDASWCGLASLEGLEDNGKPHSQGVPNRASASSPEYLGIYYSGKARKISCCTGQRCNHCPDADDPEHIVSCWFMSLLRSLPGSLICCSKRSTEYVAWPTSHEVFYTDNYQA
jgi:hypothetical protein